MVVGCGVFVFFGIFRTFFNISRFYDLYFRWNFSWVSVWYSVPCGFSHIYFTSYLKRHLKWFWSRKSFLGWKVSLWAISGHFRQFSTIFGNFRPFSWHFCKTTLCIKRFRRSFHTYFILFHTCIADVNIDRHWPHTHRNVQHKNRQTSYTFYHATTNPLPQEKLAENYAGHRGFNAITWWFKEMSDFGGKCLIWGGNSCFSSFWVIFGPFVAFLGQNRPL